MRGLGEKPRQLFDICISWSIECKEEGEVRWSGGEAPRKKFGICAVVSSISWSIECKKEG